MAIHHSFRFFCSISCILSFLFLCSCTPSDRTSGRVSVPPAPRALIFAEQTRVRAGSPVDLWAFVDDEVVNGLPAADAAAAFRWFVTGPGRPALASAEGVRNRFCPPSAGVYRVQAIAVSGGRDGLPAVLEITAVSAPAESPAPLPPASPLDWRVTEDLAGAHLARLVRVVQNSYGVRIEVSADVLRGRSAEDVPVDMTFCDAPARKVADWAARAAGGRYRVDSEDAVVIARPETWLRRELLTTLTLSYRDLDPGGGERVAALVEGLMRPARLARAAGEVTVVRSPARGDITVVGPGSAIDRFDRLLAALSAPPAPIPAAAAEPSALADRLVKKYTWSFYQKDLRAVLADHVAKDARISIGFDRREFPDGEPPKVTVDIDDEPLAAALDKIAAAASFKGYTLEEPGMVWFYVNRRPPETSEDLGAAGVLRTYDAAELVDAGLTASLIEHLIRRRVSPEAWEDPASFLGWFPERRKLVVLHNPAVQRRVTAFLHFLKADGPRLLGTADNAKTKVSGKYKTD
jgi:hypothetical protein